MPFRWPTSVFVTTVALVASVAKGFAAPNEAKIAEVPGKESLGEEGVLRRAISLYDNGRYENCVDEFQELLDPEESRRLRSPTKIETARVYHGACLIGVGRTLEAEAVFRQAIVDNPQMKTPDSLLFPEAVVELFLRVRESMLDEIRKAEQKRLRDAEERINQEQLLRALEKQRVEQLVKLAMTESVVERRERWMTFVPYGVGQFQNGNDGLGWFFLGSEVAVTSVFVTSLFLTAWYGSKMDDPGVTRQRIADLSAAQHDAYLVSTISGWGLLGLGLVGIVEANIAFSPEVRASRPRPLPLKLRELSLPPQSTTNGLSLSRSPTSTQALGAFVTGHF